MLPFIFNIIGMRGAAIIGFAVAELLTNYWNSKENPPKVCVFGRRIHHGEIGALLPLFLLFGKLPVPAASILAASILAGLGAGLVKDDFTDIKQWFRFKKVQVTNVINNC
ncbi:MAG TPA: hypothetical protein VFH25_01940 [Nitrososphaeraceae archaeon]|nr:hypothetical protein [Nitrososphaeraceae archaeon]